MWLTLSRRKLIASLSASTARSIYVIANRLTFFWVIIICSSIVRVSRIYSLLCRSYSVNSLARRIIILLLQNLLIRTISSHFLWSLCHHFIPRCRASSRWWTGLSKRLILFSLTSTRRLCFLSLSFWVSSPLIFVFICRWHTGSWISSVWQFIGSRFSWVLYGWWMPSTW